MKEAMRKKRRGAEKRGEGTARSLRHSVVIAFRRTLTLVLGGWRGFVALPWMWMFKSLLIVGFVGSLWFGQKYAWEQLDQPISKVDIRGAFTHLQEDDLRVVMTRALGKGFFSVDIDSVKQRVEQQPWVEQASIRRIWPDRLEIHVVEEVPVALWNGVSLLNPYGKAFTPADTGIVKQQLPALEGPEGQEHMVLESYVQMHEKLRAQGITILSLKLEPRGAWTIGVEGGVSVMLGREHIDDRLARFAKVFNGYLQANIAKVKLIDARYTNGVSVDWRDEPSATNDKG